MIATAASAVKVLRADCYRLDRHVTAALEAAAGNDLPAAIPFVRSRPECRHGSGDDGAVVRDRRHRRLRRYRLAAGAFPAPAVPDPDRDRARGRAVDVLDR